MFLYWVDYHASESSWWASFIATGRLFKTPSVFNSKPSTLHNFPALSVFGVPCTQSTLVCSVYSRVLNVLSLLPYPSVQCYSCNDKPIITSVSAGQFTVNVCWLLHKRVHCAIKLCSLLHKSSSSYLRTCYWLSFCADETGICILPSFHRWNCNLHFPLFFRN